MANYDDLGAVAAPPEPANPYADLGAIPLPAHDYADLGAEPITPEKLAEKDHSVIAAHAAEHPEDFETAFQADKLRRARPTSEKVGEGVKTAFTPGTWKAAGQGVLNFLGGIAQVPLDVGEHIGYALMDDPAAKTKQAEATLEAQHGELSAKRILRAIPGRRDNLPTVETDEGLVPGKLKLPKGYKEATEKLRRKTGGGDERALFAQRVEQAKNEAQLARGEPLDTGAIAGIYHAGGQQPSEEVGPAALEAEGAPPVDPAAIERASAVSDPAMLALAVIPGLPGTATLGGGATELAGKGLQVPGRALAATGKVLNPVKAIRRLVNPTSVATDALKEGGARGIGAIGRALEAQGRELRTGIPSELTTKAATAAATGESAIGTNLARKLGDTVAHGAQTAAGMAPLNYALAEGDPKAFVETEAGAAAFGATFNAFRRNRPMLVEAVRPHLRSEGARALAEASEGNDPLAAKSSAYVMSLPDETRDRTLEAIGAIQGLPATTKTGAQRTKLYVLNESDYQNVIRQTFGEKQAAMGGGRGFFITDDGKAFVNGDYHTGLAPSELSHTIGHEFGGHAAINVLRAMNSKGGALYDGLMDSAKQALFIRQASGRRQYGTPTPEFKRFVDSYNLHFDPSGETKRLDWHDPEAIEEFIAEQAGQIMAARGAGELAIPKNIQDRISEGIARFMGNLVGVDTRKVGTETKFSREEIGSLTQTVQETLAQIVGMKLRGGAEIPEPGKTDTTRMAELQVIIDTPRPAPGGPVEAVQQWIAARRSAQSELKGLQEGTTGTFPASGQPPVAPSKPGAIVSPPAITSDALKALAVMGIKGPRANALIRQANEQHGSPIEDAQHLSAGALRIHGGGSVKPGEFIPKPKGPVEPVPIPTGDKATFRDESGQTHIVTGPSTGAPRVGDIVATREGEIRRITAIKGDTVDTARPIDPLNTRGNKVHKLADIQPLEHDYAPAEPGATPEPVKPKWTVQPRGDRFIIVDAAGNPINSTTYATERDAQQGIRQKGKGKFSIFPNPTDAPDVIDTLQDRVPGIYLDGMSKEEQEQFISDAHLRKLLSTDNPAYAPDEVLRNVQPTPEEPIDHKVDSIAQLGARIEEAYRQRKSLAAQQEAEAKRLSAEKRTNKNQPNEPAPEPTTPDNLPPEPAIATALSERPAAAEEPATLSTEALDRIAAQAEEAVKASRGPRHKAATLPKAVSDAQVDAVAEAHEAGLPANYQGVRSRTDALGKKTISGTFNPSRPFDAFLLKLADISEAAKAHLLALQNKIGQTVTVNYGHAPESEAQVTAGSRKAAQAASSAQDRASGEAATQAEDKNFIPLEVRFNKGTDTPSITILGASPEKLLSNFNHAAAAVTELGGEVPYRDIHDPHLVGDMKGVARNHANGWKGDGSARIEGFPDVTIPTPDEGFKPYQIPSDRFQFLNLILGDESAKTGKTRQTPEQKLKQALAAKNRMPMTEEGETNILRESINRAKGPVTSEDGTTTTWSKATIENPLSEALRVDLINEVKPEVNNADESIRPHGYKGDIGRFFKEGSPNRTFTAAGFMPDTGIGPAEKAESDFGKAMGEKYGNEWWGPGKMNAKEMARFRILNRASSKEIAESKSKSTHFQDWDNAEHEDGKVQGYRGESGTGGDDSGLGDFKATEGVGPYIAKSPETAGFFGKVRTIAFVPPKRPLIVDEEPLHILAETDEIMEPPKPGDSDWTRLNKLAVKNAGVTDGNWGTKTEELNRQLTREVRKAGYDSVLVKSGGEEWTVLLQDPDGKRVQFMPATPFEHADSRDHPKTPQEKARERLAAGGKFMPGNTPGREEEPTPAGQGPSGSRKDHPSTEGTFTNKPVSESERKENLMQEAESAGIAPSLELMKGVLRGDRASMDKLRVMILEKTGRPAKWMPSEMTGDGWITKDGGFIPTDDDHIYAAAEHLNLPYPKHDDSEKWTEIGQKMIGTGAVQIHTGKITATGQNTVYVTGKLSPTQRRMVEDYAVKKEAVVYDGMTGRKTIMDYSEPPSMTGQSAKWMPAENSNSPPDWFTDKNIDDTTEPAMDEVARKYPDLDPTSDQYADKIGGIMIRLVQEKWDREGRSTQRPDARQKARERLAAASTTDAIGGYNDPRFDIPQAQQDRIAKEAHEAVLDVHMGIDEESDAFREKVEKAITERSNEWARRNPRPTTQDIEFRGDFRVAPSSYGNGWTVTAPDGQAMGGTHAQRAAAIHAADVYQTSRERGSSVAQIREAVERVPDATNENRLTFRARRSGSRWIVEDQHGNLFSEHQDQAAATAAAGTYRQLNDAGWNGERITNAARSDGGGSARISRPPEQRTTVSANDIDVERSGDRFIGRYRGSQVSEEQTSAQAVIRGRDAAQRFIDTNTPLARSMAAAQSQSPRLTEDQINAQWEQVIDTARRELGPRRDLDNDIRRAWGGINNEVVPDYDSRGRLGQIIREAQEGTLEAVNDRIARIDGMIRRNGITDELSGEKARLVEIANHLERQSRSSMPRLAQPRGELSPNSPIADIHAELDGKIVEQQKGIEEEIKTLSDEIDLYESAAKQSSEATNEIQRLKRDDEIAADEEYRAQPVIRAKREAYKQAVLKAITEGPTDSLPDGLQVVPINELWVIPHRSGPTPKPYYSEKEARAAAGTGEITHVILPETKYAVFRGGIVSHDTQVAGKAYTPEEAITRYHRNEAQKSDESLRKYGERLGVPEDQDSGTAGNSYAKQRADRDSRRQELQRIIESSRDNPEELANISEIRRSLIEDHGNLNSLRESLRLSNPQTLADFPRAFAEVRRLEVRGLISHEQKEAAYDALSERQGTAIAQQFLAEEAQRPANERRGRIDAKIRIAQREAQASRTQQQTMWDELLTAKQQQNLPKIARLWQQVSSEDASFTFPRTTATTPEEIANDLSLPGRMITGRSSNGGDTISFNSGNGIIYITDALDRPEISAPGANSKGRKEGGGSQLYQAALAWARNNGKVIHPSNALSTINAFVRRTSNMLSSALRFGTTKHMIPDPAQGVKWKKEGVIAVKQSDGEYKKENVTQADADAHNIAQLALRESEQVMRAVPELQSLDFDFKTGKIRDDHGKEVTPEDIERTLAQDKSKTFDRGIGRSTAQRAIITASALREAESAPEGTPARRTTGRGSRIAREQGSVLYMPESSPEHSIPGLDQSPESSGSIDSDRLKGTNANGGATTPSTVPSTGKESLTDAVTIHAKPLGQLAISDPSIIERLREGDIVTRSSVLPMVRGLLQNSKIAQSVIGLVPVDVVDMLASREGSTDGLLHDPTMLVDLFSVDANDAIPGGIEAIDKLAAILADAAAKSTRSGGDVAPLKFISTLRASEGMHLQNIPQPRANGKENGKPVTPKERREALGQRQDPKEAARERLTAKP